MGDASGSQSLAITIIRRSDSAYQSQRGRSSTVAAAGRRRASIRRSRVFFVPYTVLILELAMRSPPRLALALLAVLSPGPRLAGTLNRQGKKWRRMALFRRPKAPFFGHWSQGP